MSREEAINNIKELQNTYITCRGEEDTVAVSLDGFDIEAFDMAIKALEEESYENAINRIVKRMWNCRGKHTTSIDKVKMEQIIRNELPFVTQTSGKWIPVSERLPEDSGEYLVSVIDKEDEDYKQIEVAWFAHPKDYDIKDGEWRELMIDEKVIAWMPLPEPFEPQESEDKECTKKR